MSGASNGGTDLKPMGLTPTGILLAQRDIAVRALRDITRCDYRGNEPPEQLIARLALAEIERFR